MSGLKQSDRGEDAPFLESDPPPLIVRGLSYTLIVGFIGAVTAGSLIQLPVSVSGRFMLTPVRGTDPLRAPRSGVVDAVLVIEGQSIRETEPLFQLRSELSSDRAGEEQTLEIRIRGAEGRLANARRRSESQTKADEEEARALRRRSASLSREIELSRKKLEITKKLAQNQQRVYDEKLGLLEQTLLRQVDVAQAEADVARLEGEREQAEAAIVKLRAGMEVRARELEETERDQQEEARRAGVRLQTLRQSPVTSEEGRISLKSPCDGTIVRLHVKAAGAVVGEGEVLAEVVCAGEELQAEVSVAENSLGLVKKAHPVKLFYDAFPYERHGVRYGEVRWIGPASSVPQAARSADAPGASGGPPAIRVLATIRDGAFRVAGVPYPLLPGMAGRAEIIVDTRSAISYLLEPARALRENLAAGPPPSAPPPNERPHEP